MLSDRKEGKGIWYEEINVAARKLILVKFDGQMQI